MFVVDDHGEIAHVKPARRDAGGHEHAAHASLKVTDHALAVGLQRHAAARSVPVITTVWLTDREILNFWV